MKESKLKKLIGWLKGKVNNLLVKIGIRKPKKIK